MADAEFQDIHGTPQFDNAINEFLRQVKAGGFGSPPLNVRKMSDNEQAHDTDAYIPGVDGFRVEESTFLWYPWALAAAVEIEFDRDATEVRRKEAATAVRELVRRAKDVPGFVQSDEALYPAAENLFALNLYLSTSQEADLSHRLQHMSD